MKVNLAHRSSDQAHARPLVTTGQVDGLGSGEASGAR